MLTDNKDLSITMNKERQTVCLESAWELDALGKLLLKLESDGSEVCFQVRALGIRICDLSAVLAMGLSDSGTQTEDLEKIVNTGKP